MRLPEKETRLRFALGIEVDAHLRDYRISGRRAGVISVQSACLVVEITAIQTRESSHRISPGKPALS